jgi:predicted dienelactone hydrolase
MPGASKPTSFADPRVKAVIALSPQGAGEMGQTDHSWDNIRIPVLTMYGSRDMASQRRTPDWRSQPFHFEPPGDKYDVELQGATHFTFVGPFRPGAQEGEVFKLAKIETLAFWQAYLNNDATAKQWLQSDALARMSNGVATVARK